MKKWLLLFYIILYDMAWCVMTQHDKKQQKSSRNAKKKYDNFTDCKTMLIRNEERNNSY